MAHPMKNVMGFQVMTNGEDTHYAQQRNKIFENTVENTVSTINERIEYVYNLSESNARLRNVMEDSLLEFECKFPEFLNPEVFWGKFKGLSLEALMSNVIIHTRLQRIPTMEAIAEYIREFCWYKVQPIKVFVWTDPQGKEHLVCWDGQHTLMMLYLIGTQVHKLNSNEITIPVNIRRMTIEEARDALMSENGEGRTVFDPVDMHEQKVLAYRDTNSQVPSHVLADALQTHLEDNMMFLGNPRRGEMNKPGCLTRHEEFLDERNPVEVTKYFAQWCFSVNKSNRPFQGVEVSMMYHFFKECVESNMTVDRRYVKQVAMACRNVGDNKDDFDGIRFFTRVKSAYKKHIDYLNAKKPVEEHLPFNPDRDKREKLFTFLCAMLESKGIDVPTHHKFFTVDDKDLF